MSMPRETPVAWSGAFAHRRSGHQASISLANARTRLGRLLKRLLAAGIAVIGLQRARPGPIPFVGHTDRSPVERCEHIGTDAERTYPVQISSVLADLFAGTSARYPAIWAAPREPECLCRHSNLEGNGGKIATRVLRDF